MAAAITLRASTRAERDTDTATAVMLSPLPRLPVVEELCTGADDGVAAPILFMHTPSEKII